MLKTKTFRQTPWQSFSYTLKSPLCSHQCLVFARADFNPVSSYIFLNMWEILSQHETLAVHLVKRGGSMAGRELNLEFMLLSLEMYSRPCLYFLIRLPDSSKKTFQSNKMDTSDMDRVLKYIYVMEASLGKSGKGRFSSHYLNLNPCHLPFY